jgi:galactokinase
VLVGLANEQAGCFGSRLTGGGFGGCTVNLVAAERVEGFVGALRAGYKGATGIAAEIYVSRASAGAAAIEF